MGKKLNLFEFSRISLKKWFLTRKLDIKKVSKKSKKFAAFNKTIFEMDFFAANSENPLTGLCAQDLSEIAKHAFVWIEQTALTYLLGYQNQEDFSEVLNNLPRVIYSSDLGQTSQITILEWLEISEKWFSEFKISPKRRAELCLKNPAQLLMI